MARAEAISEAAEEIKDVSQEIKKDSSEFLNRALYLTVGFAARAYKSLFGKSEAAEKKAAEKEKVKEAIAKKRFSFFRKKE